MSDHFRDKTRPTGLVIHHQNIRRINSWIMNSSFNKKSINIVKNKLINLI